MHGVRWECQHCGMRDENRPTRTGGRSSVDRLPDTLREAVDAAIADGATIDEITARIREGGGDCSRSAVGRYSKDARELIRQQQETDRTIEAWVQELGARPEGGTGLFLIETLRTMTDPPPSKWSTLSLLKEEDRRWQGSATSPRRS